MSGQKSVYICGPLTDLQEHDRQPVKDFYERIAGVCRQVTGVEPFVPHRHFDPIQNASATPNQIDTAEREQVCHRTSCLVVVNIAPSWGGGIEVEMANQAGVPVIILSPRGKSLSRLLQGNPAVIAVVEYDSEDDALESLEYELSVIFG